MKCPSRSKNTIDVGISPPQRLFPCLQTQLTCLIITLLLTALGLLVNAPHYARANPALPTDLSYSTETSWLLPGLPDLSATSGYIPHNFSHGETIFRIDNNEIIHGFRPGKAYSEMYIRDITWGMETVQYYYPDEYLREPIEAYLRRQYNANTTSLDGDFGLTPGQGAIGGIMTPEGHSNKQTITTDEETSLIHAAYLYYNMAYNTGWLQKPINNLPIIERLNLAADWLYTHRLDPQLNLLWRGHTTDWGNVTFEKRTNQTDYKPAQDQLTISIYDQALAHLALLELAEMNAAVGDNARADEWQNKAESLKKEINTLLWQTNKGFYLLHFHLTDLDHNFDESAMVSITNALAVYARLTDFQKNRSIFHNLEQARLDAKAKKPGLSLYPYYPDHFFHHSKMGSGTYQNGGIWDWWGGIQIKAEFLSGFSQIGQQHLLQIIHEWQKHPGNIHEWQSVTPGQEGSHYYSAAAGTMGSAIIEGFFGVELDGGGLTLQPRLGLNDGHIRVYQAATDRYAAYSYDWNQTITKLSYGTNAKGAITIKLLKLRSEHIDTITIDGHPVEFKTETIGHDTYTVFTAPNGQHTVELTKGQPVVQIAADIGPVSPSETAGQDPTTGIARNVNAPHQTIIDQRLSPFDTAPTQMLTKYDAYETRLAFIQAAGVILIMLMCLAVMAWFITHRLGLRIK